MPAYKIIQRNGATSRTTVWAPSADEAIVAAGGDSNSAAILDVCRDEAMPKQPGSDRYSLGSEANGIAKGYGYQLKSAPKARRVF